MLVILLALSFATFSLGALPWNQWHSGVHYQDVYVNHDYYYYPWQCCLLCGDGNVYRNFSFQQHRCRYMGELQDVPHDATSIATIRYPTVEQWYQCCYWCGDEPGDFVLVDHNQCRSHIPMSQWIPYRRHLSDSGDNPIRTDVANLRSSSSPLVCMGCRAFVLLVTELVGAGADHITDKVRSYCALTVIFRQLCRELVDTHFTSVIMAIHNNISSTEFCGNVVRICPAAVVKNDMLRRVSAAIHGDAYSAPAIAHG